jgi:hypothetical protein
MACGPTRDCWLWLVEASDRSFAPNDDDESVSVGRSTTHPSVKENHIQLKVPSVLNLRRAVACAVLAIVGVIGVDVSPASAAPAQLLQDGLWRIHSSGTSKTCQGRSIDLAAGNYLWENYERIDGQYTHRVKRIIYLAAGTYSWNNCLEHNPPWPCADCTGIWSNYSRLTHTSGGGGFAELQGGFYTGPRYPYANNNYITRFGSNLWQCATESVC